MVVVDVVVVVVVVVGRGRVVVVGCGRVVVVVVATVVTTTLVLGSVVSTVTGGCVGGGTVAGGTVGGRPASPAEPDPGGTDRAAGAAGPPDGGTCTVLGGCTGSSCVAFQIMVPTAAIVPTATTAAVVATPTWRDFRADPATTEAPLIALAIAATAVSRPASSPALAGCRKAANRSAHSADGWKSSGVFTVPLSTQQRRRYRKCSNFSR